MKTNDYSAFLQQLNSALTHLQEQEAISHEWLNQMQKDGSLLLYLYDNNKPLYYQVYHQSKQELKAAKEAVSIAKKKHQMDIFSGNVHQIIAHTEFDFTSSDKENYYASAGKCRF